VLAADPAVVMSTIVGANTALECAASEQRFGRAMTDRDFEILTLASAHNAQKATPRIMWQPELGAFQISRALATFFEARWFPVPDALLATTAYRRNSTRCRRICAYPPILRRYMPRRMFKHVRPAR